MRLTVQVEDALSRLDEPRVIEVEQVIYALERAERRLQAEADALHDAHDYGAEFPAEDAERMREAIALLKLGSGAPLASRVAAETVGLPPAALGCNEA